MRLLDFLNEHDVVNPGAIDTAIEDLLNLFYDTDLYNNTFVKKWLLSVAKKAIINSDLDLNRLTMNSIERLRYDKDDDLWKLMNKNYPIDKIEQNIKDGKDVYVFDYSDNFVEYRDGSVIEKLHHIMDYFSVDLPTRTINMTVDQAYRKANEFFAEQTKKANSIMNPADIEVIKKYSNGSYWCIITNQVEMLREGKLMNNCIGTVYTLKVTDTPYIYSFRTKDNIPHISVRYHKSNNEIQECKANSNSIVPEKYRDYIIDIINYFQNTPNLCNDIRRAFDDDPLVKLRHFKKMLKLSDVDFKTTTVEYVGEEYILTPESLKEICFILIGREDFLASLNNAIMLLNKKTKKQVKFIVGQNYTNAKKNRLFITNLIPVDFPFEIYLKKV